MVKKTILAIFLTAAFSAPLSAGEIVLQNGLSGYNGCIDTYLHVTGNGAGVLFQYHNENFHAKTTMETANSPNSCGFPAFARAVCRFDLSALTVPAGAVKKATFSMYFLDGTKGKEKRRLYRITKDWVAHEATWLVAKSGEPWDSQSSDTLKQGGAYTVENGAEAPYAPAGQWEHFDVTAIVTYFLTNPNKNSGFLVIDDEADGHTQRVYASSDYTEDPSLRPKLTIEHSTSVFYFRQPGPGDGVRLRITGPAVRISLPSGSTGAIVRNAKGQTLFNLAGDCGGRYEIPRDRLRAGIHFLTVVRNNGNSTIRFVVAK